MVIALVCLLAGTASAEVQRLYVLDCGLVRLPKSGYVVLSGDAVHFRDNWEHKRVPSMNVSAEQTLASLARLQRVLDERHAQLWINHDKAQSAGLRYTRPPTTTRAAASLR